MQTTISYQSFVFKSEGWSINQAPLQGNHSTLANGTPAPDGTPPDGQNQAGRTTSQSVDNNAAQPLNDSFAKGLKVLAFELSNVFQGALGGLQNTQATPPKPPAQKPIAAFQPPSASEVAKNVLGFVESRLQKEKANGASDERLNKLFDAARSGVKKGFAEARGQIKQLGLNSDKLSAAVDESYTKINKGIDQLQQRILSPDQASATSPDTSSAAPVSGSDASSAATSAPTTTTSSTDQNGSNQVDQSAPSSGSTPVASQQSVGYDSQSLNENAGSIKIKTQDGDIITVSIKDISALQQHYAAQSASDGQGNRLSSVTYDGKSLQSSAFKFSVKGNLDSGELKAIGDLLGKVGNLAQQFFGGDVQGAFQNALSLGYDGQQIASFSLNLSQTQYQKVSAYQSVSQLGNNAAPASASKTPAGQASITPANSAPPKLDALSNFAEGLSKLIDQSRQIGIPPKVPGDIISRLLGQSGLDQNTLDQQQQYLKSLNDQLTKTDTQASPSTQETASQPAIG